MVKSGFDFDWLRYKRQIDDAGRYLNLFDRFKILYYIEKARESYTEAMRVLKYMLNKYRDYDMQTRLMTEYILLNSQINDLDEMIRELKKGFYK